MIDLLVIGAGLSGLMAAYTAAKAGLKVRVVAKGLGAIHWTPATIDVFGYPLGEEMRPIKRPLDFIDQLGDDDPEHPYVLLGRERVENALQAFLALSQEIGLPYGGARTPGDNLLLPSPAGAARPTYLAPQAQLAGDLSRPEPMLIVGFHGTSTQGGMRDFYPELIAENLNKQGFRARAAFLPFSLLTDRVDSNTVQLAHGLDDRVRRARLSSELRKLVKPGERVGLPALLGVDQHMTFLAELEKQVGAPIFEIPTLPPSVPGVRLFQALRNKLYAMGVRVEPNMRVIGHEISPSQNGGGARIRWVETESSSRPLKHRAGKFVLATGGILGGGFDSDHTGKVWEVVFDLPLNVPQRRSEWFRPQFLNPDGHPVFNGGVGVDRHMQPVDDAGKPIYENLWAAGDLLANDNPILQRSMEGACIATGVAAGLAASAPSDS
jgi:glycerol-3-phosphate dehydrogenase subunit B